MASKATEENNADRRQHMPTCRRLYRDYLLRMRNGVPSSRQAASRREVDTGAISHIDDVSKVEDFDSQFRPERHHSVGRKHLKQQGGPLRVGN